MVNRGFNIFYYVAGRALILFVSFNFFYFDNRVVDLLDIEDNVVDHKD